MASPAPPRPSTATPTSRMSRDERLTPRKNHNSPYRHSPHRSSPQILAEELSHLRLQEDRAFRQLQDERDAEQERRHQRALEIAAAEHERVRLYAVRAAERSELEQERQRKQREEEEHRALEAERAAKLEREAEERRRRREALERQEEEQKRRAAEEKEIQERQNRLAEQKRKDEQDAARRKKEQEDADHKAQQEAAAQAAHKEAPPPVPTPAATQTAPTPAIHGHPPAAAPQLSTQAPAPTTQATPQPASTAIAQPGAQSATQSATNSVLVSPAAQREALHNQYLTIHKRLKVMRQEVVKMSKTIPALKQQLGDWRREINKDMGQFGMNRKVENRERNRKIIAILSEAARHSEPSVNVTPLIAAEPANAPEKRMSGPLVYLLNIAAKSAVRQSVAEGAQGADPIATVLATLFSKPDFKLEQKTSLIDIVLAKYHVVCPVLFGINGNERTKEGREKLAWWTEDGHFITAERHSERMTGVARSYACLSLRDFSKSTMINPFPPSNYWKSLSYIVNTPSAELQPTHFIVVKALIEGNLERFIKFYGQAALVALRQALVELPRRAPQGAARDVVAVMPQQMQRDLSLTL